MTNGVAHRVGADLRDEAVRQAENWLMAFGALIPASELQNLSIKLAADLAKPAIDLVAQQAEQIAAVLALHAGAHWCNDRFRTRGWFDDPCPTARALGVTDA